jgi:hypothetical protein
MDGAEQKQPYEGTTNTPHRLPRREVHRQHPKDFWRKMSRSNFKLILLA